MKLTGKCKADFEKFLTVMFPEMGIKGTNWSELVYKWFIMQHQSMQYGVYVDFFESNNFYFDSDVGWHNGNNKKILFKTDIKEQKNLQFLGIVNAETREELRTKTIEKANEIYNKQ